MDCKDKKVVGAPKVVTVMKVCCEHGTEKEIMRATDTIVEHPEDPDKVGHKLEISLKASPLLVLDALGHLQDAIKDNSPNDFADMLETLATSLLEKVRKMKSDATKPH